MVIVTQGPKRRGAPNAWTPAAKAPRPDTSGVQQLVQRYHNEGRLNMNRFDDAILLALHRLGPEGAVQALEKFCLADLTKVKNYAAFLKVVINSLKDPQQPPAGKGAATAPRPGAATAPRTPAAKAPPAAAAAAAAAANAPPPGAATVPRTPAAKAPPAGAATAPRAAHPGPTHSAPAGPTIHDVLQEHHNLGLLDQTQLDAGVVAELEALQHNQALEALRVYEESDRSEVQDHNSFMKSIIANLPPAQQAAPKGQGGQEAAAVDPAAVKAQLDTIIAAGWVSAEKCDDQLLASLASLPPPAASKALEEFVRIVSTAPVKMPNPATFLAATIRRYQRAEEARRKHPEGLEEVLRHHQEKGLLAEGEFDAGILANLSALPPGGAKQAVAEYLSADLSAIRNRQAFMKGIVKRIMKEGVDPKASLDMVPPKQRQPPSGGPSGSLGGPAANSLPALLSHYKALGVLADGDFDEVILDQLSNLPNHLVTEAFAEFAASDPAGIRNKSAFMKGILNRLGGFSGPVAGPIHPGTAGRMLAAGRPAPMHHPAPAPYAAPLPRSAPAPYAAPYGGAPQAWLPQGPPGASLEDLLGMYCANGMISPDEFDEGVQEQLTLLPPPLMEQALVEYLESDRSNMRNRNSYMMGIIRNLRNNSDLAYPVAPVASVPIRGPYTLGFGAAQLPAPRRAFPPRGIPIARPPTTRPVGAARSPPSAAVPRPAMPQRMLAAPAESVGTPEAAEMLFCPSCGFQQPSVNFCVKCGFQMKEFLSSIP